MATQTANLGGRFSLCPISSSIATTDSTAVMLPFKLVYHEGYDLRLGQHVFQSQKFGMVRDALLAEKIADGGDFLSPEPATDEDILRVHTPDWVDKLKHD